MTHTAPEVSLSYPQRLMLDLANDATESTHLVRSQVLTMGSAIDPEHILRDLRGGPLSDMVVPEGHSLHAPGDIWSSVVAASQENLRHVNLFATIHPRYDTRLLLGVCCGLVITYGQGRKLAGQILKIESDPSMQGREPYVISRTLKTQTRAGNALNGWREHSRVARLEPKREDALALLGLVRQAFDQRTQTGS